MVEGDAIRCDDQAALSKVVMDFVFAGLEVARQRERQPLIIIGDHHKRPSSVIAAIAALKAVNLAHGGDAAYLIEQRPENCERIIQSTNNFVVASDSEDAARLDKKLGDHLAWTQRDTKEYTPRRHCVKAHAALTLGFNIASFDTHHDLPNREQMMVAAILEHAANGGAPVVVVTGGYHLPVLQEALCEKMHVIPLASITADVVQEAMRDRDIRDASYLLTHDAIKRFEPTDALETQPFAYRKFMDDLDQLNKPAQGEAMPGSLLDKGT